MALSHHAAKNRRTIYLAALYDTMVFTVQVTLQWHYNAFCIQRKCLCICHNTTASD